MNAQKDRLNQLRDMLEDRSWEDIFVLSLNSPDFHIRLCLPISMSDTSEEYRDHLLGPTFVSSLFHATLGTHFGRPVKAIVAEGLFVKIEPDDHTCEIEINPTNPMVTSEFMNSFRKGFAAGKAIGEKRLLKTFKINGSLSMDQLMQTEGGRRYLKELLDRYRMK